MLTVRKPLPFAALLVLSLVLWGCGLLEDSSKNLNDEANIRELIKSAGNNLSATDNFSLVMDAQIVTASQEKTPEAPNEIDTTVHIQGTVDNTNPRFYFVGDVMISNQSVFDYFFSMVEPETSGYMPYINLLYDRELAAGDTYNQSFQVLGIETSALPNEIWNDYGAEDYVIFHDLVDGRLRFYCEEDYTLHYSDRVNTALTALAAEASELEVLEQAETIEISGKIEGSFTSVLTLFWINANHLFVDYFPDAFYFSLLLDTDNYLPLKFTLGGDNQKVHVLETSGYYAVEFKRFNQTRSEASVPSEQIVYFAPDGFADESTVYPANTSLPLPEIIEADWNSRSLQIDQKILTLPITVQDLMDLGFTPPNPGREIMPDSLHQEIFTRDGLKISVRFTNLSNETRPINESDIQSISLFSNHLEIQKELDVPIYFPGGISVGSYLEEVANRLPAPEQEQLIGGDTFRTAHELRYMWGKEAGIEHPSLEYSIHPQSKLVFYLSIQ